MLASTAQDYLLIDFDTVSSQYCKASTCSIFGCSRKKWVAPSLQCVELSSSNLSRHRDPVFFLKSVDVFRDCVPMNVGSFSHLFDAKVSRSRFPETLQYLALRSFRHWYRRSVLTHNVNKLAAGYQWCVLIHKADADVRVEKSAPTSGKPWSINRTLSYGERGHESLPCSS